MSYIRATSNPEGLYIWHDESTDRIHITGAGIDNMIQVSRKEFHKLAIKWNRGYYFDKPCVHGDLTLKSIRDKEGYKLKFSYKNRWFIMWQVTWEHIVNNILKREE